MRVTCPYTSQDYLHIISAAFYWCLLTCCMLSCCLRRCCFLAVVLQRLGGRCGLCLHPFLFSETLDLFCSTNTVPAISKRPSGKSRILQQQHKVSGIKTAERAVAEVGANTSGSDSLAGGLYLLIIYLLSRFVLITTDLVGEQCTDCSDCFATKLPWRPSQARALQLTKYHAATDNNATYW